MSTAVQPDRDILPAHVAIIMDGNGRWAQSRGLMRLLGHKAGVETVRAIVRAAREIGIRVLTLYAFSTENWKRPADEVNGLMSLLQSFLRSELNSMQQHDISLRCMGRIDRLPPEVGDILRHCITATAGNHGLILNLALSYGGREEILRAARNVARLCCSQHLVPEEISEEIFASHLYSAGLPDPDLVIRTGGERRLSNFLLWQASYAELFFTDVHWPDFSKELFFEALADFQLRQRRFGKTGEQVRG